MSLYTSIIINTIISKNPKTEIFVHTMKNDYWIKNYYVQIMFSEM